MMLRRYARAGQRIRAVAGTALLALLLPALAAAAPEAAGRVSHIVGQATAAGADGSIRPLAVDAELMPGDTIVTHPNSFLRMKFTDESAMLLRPNTRFRIEAYRVSLQPEENRGFFRLLKGGFRAVTGLIGKRNRNSYRIRTAVATIGIRGTDFEGRLCQDDCQDVDPPPADGLYVGAQENEVFVENGSGVCEIGAEQACFVADENSAPETLPAYPDFLRNPPCECPGL